MDERTQRPLSPSNPGCGHSSWISRTPRAACAPSRSGGPSRCAGSARMWRGSRGQRRAPRSPLFQRSICRTVTASNPGPSRVAIPSVRPRERHHDRAPGVAHLVTGFAIVTAHLVVHTGHDAGALPDRRLAQRSSEWTCPEDLRFLRRDCATRTAAASAADNSGWSPCGAAGARDRHR